MMDPVVNDLVREAARIVREYQKHPRTPLLKELAPVIVELRSHFTLKDGRPDWSGRSPEYRQCMSDIFAKARVPADDLDRLQSALRYHVGNILRDRATKDELLSVGLTTVKPKERIQNTRDALQAMKQTSAPRYDVARLTAYAQALLEYIDDRVVARLDPDRAEASRLALEAIHSRAEELLVRIPGAKEGRRTRRNGGRSKREERSTAEQPCLLGG